MPSSTSRPRSAPYADLPMDQAPSRPSRLRRGGPRTPLPLLPLIAIAAGIGLAYVNETAHTTSAGYRAAQLAAARDRLTAQDEQLEDELSRLEASERIVSAAQRFGMRPAGRWAYVVAEPVPVVPSPPAAHEASASSPTAVQRLLAALTGDFGSGVPR